MSREQLLTDNAHKLLEDIKKTKRAIANLRARASTLSSQPVAKRGPNIKDIMKGILRPDLVPGNVGHLNEVTWSFNHQVDFNLSELSGWPSFTRASSQTKSFQVSQESAVLLTGVSRHANDYSVAGDLGPWLMEIRDRQSSRFFNNSPVPIQTIAQKGFITPLPVSMLVMPNAFIDVTLSNFLSDGVTQTAVGETTGVHQFSFHGYRIRIEDAEKVLSSIFKG